MDKRKRQAIGLLFSLPLPVYSFTARVVPSRIV
jgi:uncharacterized membrane protein